jgi:hypothetical protein
MRKLARVGTGACGFTQEAAIRGSSRFEMSQWSEPIAKDLSKPRKSAVRRLV